jgi:transposase
MIPEDTRSRVQRLREAGKSIRSIARESGIARNTVREILGLRKKPPPKEEEARRSFLLDPYKKAIEEILREEDLERRKDPGRKPLTSRKILKEIRKLGYTGGRTILDDHLRRSRGPQRRSRKAWVRFETSPAEEAQQDWSAYRVEIGGKRVLIQVFSLILAWSRYQFFKAFPDQKLHSLLWGHVAALKYIEGIPWTIVYDRQATISPCEVAGVPILNAPFKEFSEHYGFSVSLCLPGHKERKGKIEKPFLLFETDFLPRRTFTSLEDLNRQILAWLAAEESPGDGNHRHHGTTGEIPYERWLEEKKYLIELPRTDHVPRRIEKRHVGKDATVSVGGCLYTVPARLVEEGRREVWVSLGEEDLQIYDERGELVARHAIERGPGKLVIDPAHYEEIRRRKHGATQSELERRFLERFPRSERFLDGLRQAVRSIAPIHLREILALERRYRSEEVERALAEALDHGTATAGYVRELLSRRHPSAPLAELHRETPRGLRLGPIDPGNADGYDRIFLPPTQRKDANDEDHDRQS